MLAGGGTDGAKYCWAGGQFEVVAVETVPVLMHAKHNVSDIESMIKVVIMLHGYDACVHMLHAFCMHMYFDEATGIASGFMTTIA